MSKINEIMPESERILCLWAKAQDYVNSGRIYRKMNGSKGREVGLLRGVVLPAFRRNIIFPVGALRYSLYENKDLVVIETPEDLRKAIRLGGHDVRLEVYLGGRLNGWSRGGVKENRLNEHSDEIFTIIGDAQNTSPTIRSAKGDDPEINLSGTPREMATSVIRYIEGRIRGKRR